MTRYTITFTCMLNREKVDHDAFALNVANSLSERPHDYESSSYHIDFEYRQMEFQDKFEAARFAITIRDELQQLSKPYGGTADSFDICEQNNED